MVKNYSLFIMSTITRLQKTQAECEICIFCVVFVKYFLKLLIFDITCNSSLLIFYLNCYRGSLVNFWNSRGTSEYIFCQSNHFGLQISDSDVKNKHPCRRQISVSTLKSLILAFERTH